MSERVEARRKTSRLLGPSPTDTVARQPDLALRPQHANKAPPIVDEVLRSSGQPLDDTTRAFMEPRFGFDFGQVRVHTDERAAQSAASVSALAYTVGQDVVFGAGQYAPGTSEGRRLVAHELTHVAQQEPAPPLARTLTIEDQSETSEQVANTIADQVAGTNESPVRADIGPGSLEHANSRPIALQRQPTAAPPAPDQQQTSPPANPPGGTTTELPSRDELESIRFSFGQRAFLSAAFGELGQSVLYGLKSSAIVIDQRYAEAFERHSRVVEAAKEAAKQEQEWADIALGIGCGVIVGLAAEVIIPAAALEEAATAVTVGVEFGKEVVKTGVEQGAKATGAFDVAGTDMRAGSAGGGADRGAMSPAALESRTWKEIELLHSSMDNVTKVSQGQLLLMSDLEYAIGELRVRQAGQQGDMPDDALLQLVNDLRKANTACQPLDAELSRRLGGMQTLAGQIPSASDYSVDDLEKDIWILWMATIPDDESGILDRDPIEDHLTAIGVLGKNSLLGVDFGWWTTKSDTLEAVAAARAKAGELREKYRTLTSYNAQP